MEALLILIVIMVLLVCMTMTRSLPSLGPSLDSSGCGCRGRMTVGKMGGTTVGERDNQLHPGHIVILTEADKSKEVNPPSDLLCNWRDCKMGPNGAAAGAIRLCPFCHRVGYCCVYCMEQDIYGHVSHNCAQNVKKTQIQKV